MSLSSPLWLLLPACSQRRKPSACSITDGIVTAVEFEDITAPCSGTLYSFDLNAGDTVSAGDLLFELLTISVAAPEDGTVRYLFAGEGDSADAAMRTYGAVLAMEPTLNLRLSCTYSGAADYEDCKHMHIGDILYFKYDKEKGTGVVISTADNAYEVEVLSGKFDSGKSLELYKDNDYAYDNRVGTGKVYKRNDVTIAGAGRIVQFFVSEGDKVKKGELFAFLGVNGAGKSTTISMICGQLQKDSCRLQAQSQDHTPSSGTAPARTAKGQPVSLHRDR